MTNPARPSFPVDRQSAAELLSGTSRPSHGTIDESPSSDGSTLEMTLEKIGMGTYQKRLLVLCGFGWLADNMWLQSVAVILPRVQEQFDISDRWIGLLTSSLFCGMMLGAWAWGSYSDSKGRTPAFNFTLLLASVFGCAAGFATSFFMLCCLMFGLGVGVGGSMPTDGTLFLENIPKSRHYLLTGLSVFFSFGAVLASVLGLYIIPRFSCAEDTTEECDMDRENTGWRIMLRCCGGITLLMLICRTLFFKLRESPSWLVQNNQPEAALIVLQHINDLNGSEFVLRINDVVSTTSATATKGNRSPSFPPAPQSDVREPLLSPALRSQEEEINPLDKEFEQAEKTPSWLAALPQPIGQPIYSSLKRMEGLFTPDWRLTTLLVWAIWTLISAGYTIFNAFLPSWLERKLGGESHSSRQESLQEYVAYTVAGIPGALIGSWIIGTPLGQRNSMALGTICSVCGILVFIFISSKPAVVLTICLISFVMTLTYAVIYSFTPATFDVEVRGTACGVASSLSRLAGVVAPLLTGVLLAISPILPLFASSALFLAAAVCMKSLPFENGTSRA